LIELGILMPALSVYQLKPAFQGLLRPITRLLFKLGVTANMVTAFAALGSVAYGVELYRDPTASTTMLWLAPLLFVRMALNAIDGMLAREHNQRSPLGAFFNELGDVVADTAIYLPFAVVPGIHPALVVGVVLLSTWSEFAGALGVMVGADRRYDGPMGKSDRAFVFAVLGLLLGLGVQAGCWTDAVLALMGGLLAVTIGNRVRSALRQAR
jgi:CDP-diacylglycerol--glycerol-3-phosphate 3-phosphatidyltransferase